MRYLYIYLYIKRGVGRSTGNVQLFSLVRTCSPGMIVHYVDVYLNVYIHIYIGIHWSVEIISTSSYRELSTICCFLGCIIGGNNSLEYICSDPRQHCFDHGTGTPAYLGDIWDWLIVRLRFTLLYVIFRLLDSNLKVTFELWLVRVCRGLFSHMLPVHLPSVYRCGW